MVLDCPAVRSRHLVLDVERSPTFDLDIRLVRALGSEHKRSRLRHPCGARRDDDMTAVRERAADVMALAASSRKRKDFPAEIIRANQAQAIPGVERRVVVKHEGEIFAEAWIGHLDVGAEKYLASAGCATRRRPVKMDGLATERSRLRGASGVLNGRAIAHPDRAGGCCRTRRAEVARRRAAPDTGFNVEVARVGGDWDGVELARAAFDDFGDAGHHL